MKRDYDQLILEFEKKYPAYYNLKYNIDIPSIQRLQQWLQHQPNTAILEFFHGTTAVYTLTITNTTFDLFRTDLEGDFHQNIQDFRKALTDIQFIQKSPKAAYQLLTTNGYQLYQTLLQRPLNQLKDVSNLIIIADGVLGFVPYETLLSKVPNTNQRNYQTLPYLIQDYTIYRRCIVIVTVSPFPSRINHRFGKITILNN